MFSANVVLKSKIKGASYYEESGADYIIKTSGRVKLLTTRKSKASLLKKSTRVRFRAVRKVNSYCTSYGPWGKAKKVKVK